MSITLRYMIYTWRIQMGWERKRAKIFIVEERVSDVSEAKR